jgi:hypothetical protein
MDFGDKNQGYFSPERVDRGNNIAIPKYNSCLSVYFLFILFLYSNRRLKDHKNQSKMNRGYALK